MNPLSMVVRAEFCLEKAVHSGMMQVFRACKPRNPVRVYEEYRCVACSRVRNDGRCDLVGPGEDECRVASDGRNVRGFDCTGSGGRISTDMSEERRRRTFSGRGIGVVISSTC